ncbi:MAG: hypothetical protein Q8Q89_00345 [bacterium]|nr:hypothetical protein [bacterium]
MQKVLILIFIGGISLVGLVIIVLTFDPVQSAGYVKFLFYSLLFALFLSLGTAGFFYLDRKNELQFEIAFKRGFLLSLVILAIFIWLRIK